MIGVFLIPLQTGAHPQEMIQGDGPAGIGCAGPLRNRSRGVDVKLAPARPGCRPQRRRHSWTSTSRSAACPAKARPHSARRSNRPSLTTTMARVRLRLATNGLREDLVQARPPRPGIIPAWVWVLPAEDPHPAKAASRYRRAPAAGMSSFQARARPLPPPRSREPFRSYPGRRRSS